MNTPSGENVVVVALNSSKVKDNVSRAPPESLSAVAAKLIFSLNLFLIKSES